MFRVMKDQRYFQNRLEHNQVFGSSGVSLKVDSDQDPAVNEGQFDIKKIYNSSNFSTKEALNHIIDVSIRVTEWELIALK